MQCRDPFENALSHAMLYEVGKHWNLELPGVKEGLIDTKEQRRNVGYVNDPVDRGGETKYGVASKANPQANITRLDWDGARRIYDQNYWTPSRCADLSARVAALHFDGAVNHGVKRAAVFLQKAVGVEPDGIIGKATIAKADLVDQITVATKICDMREQFYRSIVQKNPSQIKFLNGWLRRINEMRAFILCSDNFVA